MCAHKCEELLVRTAEGLGKIKARVDVEQTRLQFPFLEQHSNRAALEQA